jgi:hypothetical protein
MTGKYQMGELDPIRLPELPAWEEIKDHVVARRSYWWGGGRGENLMWRTMGIRSFLSITEPHYQTFRLLSGNAGEREAAFGLWFEKEKSLALAHGLELTGYGSKQAFEAFLKAIETWTKMGMPGATSFRVKAYPIDETPSLEENSWLSKRRESQFLWTLS